jgi:DNA topoisomerase VI subunit B
MKASKAEKVNQQSAAEFFSEHQQIAGFDNPGKSLYTTIREFVENSLDACESIHILPDIKLSVVEYSEEEHNIKHGIKLYSKKGGAAVDLDDDGDSLLASQADEKATKKKKHTPKIAETKAINYYDITCKDNGCGIHPDSVGNMLGRVLSGSKHGTRQTRGKFGLGAKMALIWSKKSSGLPITVRTAHSTSPSVVPETVTTGSKIIVFFCMKVTDSRVSSSCARH